MKLENVPASETLPFRMGPTLPALGVASLLAASTSAYGQIVYSGTLNTLVATTTTDFNVDGSTPNDFQLKSLGYGEGGYIKFSGIGFSTVPLLDANSEVSRLSSGTWINSGSSNWATYSNTLYRVWETYNNTEWGTGNEVGTITGYVGFRFAPSSIGALKYGWMQLSIQANGGGAAPTVTMVDFAYEDSGGAIQAGVTAIPEPSAVALVMGAASLLALRKRRRQAA